MKRAARLGTPCPNAALWQIAIHGPAIPFGLLRGHMRHGSQPFLGN